jgi:hypothetical protein
MSVEKFQMSLPPSDEKAFEVDASVMEGLIHLIREMNEHKERLARAAAVGICPRCGAQVRTAHWQMFLEAGIGLTERLVAMCDAGCEYAVGDVSMEWVHLEDVELPARVRMKARVLAGVVRRECAPSGEDV